jgi:hypothetical protein
MVQLRGWKGAGVGVIDAIADGCFAVARRPAVLVPVVALDLVYWLGGRLTPAPFTEGIVRLLEMSREQNPSGPDPADTIATLRSLAEQSDLLALLALGQKPLLPQLGVDQVGRPWGAGTVDPGHWAVVIAATVGLAIVGLLWLALALSAVAPLVRDEPFEPLAILRRVPRCWVRLLGLCAIILGGLALLIGPILFLATILGLLGINPAPLGLLLTLLLFPLGILLYVYLALAPEAIAVSDVGPLRAIKLSVTVVRRNFWPMIGLLAATILIEWGFPIGWSLVTRQAAGVPLAIVGNAFIGTGLMAAAMFFYRERLEKLEVRSEKLEGRGVK